MADTLVWGIKTGDMEVVQANLKVDNVNLVVEKHSGRYPLHIAADFGQADVMKYLFSIGANVNVLDKLGFSPLMCACYENHFTCVKLLLAKGADKGLIALNGECAVDAAECEEIKELLKCHGDNTAAEA